MKRSRLIVACVVIVAAAVFGFRTVGSNSVEAAGATTCCCGPDCKCEVCDCATGVCTNCNCEACNCTGCECGEECGSPCCKGSTA